MRQITRLAMPDGSTPDEPWMAQRERDHWYNAAADFALESLTGSGACLVIGSPLFEAAELADRFDVTYVDVRRPVLLDKRVSFVQHDASSLPFPDASFDCVSTTCVLCHAGMGRYGDEIAQDADRMVLREIARVLKPGGLAAVTFGPVVNQPQMIEVGNTHRVYTLGEAADMVADARLSVVETRIWDTSLALWKDGLPNHGINDGVLGDFDYLSMLLRG